MILIGWQNLRVINYLKLFHISVNQVLLVIPKQLKGTWEQYKKETGNKYATRARFKDSVDFIGWYVNKTHKLLKIPKNDAYRQYLAYYKGMG